MKKISIYGIGNFGYALLKHLDKKSDKMLDIHVFDRNKQVIKLLRSKRVHPNFHKGVKISEKVKFEDNVKDLIKDCDVLILAVNSFATREVLREVKKYINQELIIINTAKALDFQTGKRLSEISKEELEGINYSYALLAGGTIAKDLFKHEPLGVDIACEELEKAKLLKDIFTSENLKVYVTTDLAGVEYASAFKNVISILAGIINGMGFSYGSETYIISRAAHEVETIVINKLGGKKETFSMISQCWGNDLWMSCTGKTRNREFGILLGKGLSVEKAERKMEEKRKSVEGINTIQVLDRLAKLNDYPLLDYLYRLIAKKTIGIEIIKQVIYTRSI